MNGEAPESQTQPEARNQKAKSNSCLNTLLDMFIFIVIAVILVGIALTLLGPTIGNIINPILSTTGPVE